MQGFNNALLLVLRGVRRLVDRTEGEDGQTLAEYGLIVTVIAVGVVVTAMIVFRDVLAAGFDAGTRCLTGLC